MRKHLIWSVYILITLLFLLFLWFFGLRNANDWQENSPTGLGGDIGEKYVMVTFQSGIDYWRPVMKGFEDGGQALGVSVEFRGAAKYDANEQITILENIIARKPAGIALTAIDPKALNNTIAKADQAGIPIILFDSGATGSKAYSFVGTDNYKAGAEAARKMGNWMKGKGKVAVITQPGQLNQQQRTEGFVDTLHFEFPNIQVVEVADGQGDIDASAQVASDLLARYPGLGGFFATQANGGIGIANVLKSQRLDGHVTVISFDTDKGTLDMVKDGTIQATIAQGTWNMGYWTMVELFHLHHRLIQPGYGGANPAHSLPPFIDTGITFVTKENVENYYAK